MSRAAVSPWRRRAVVIALPAAAVAAVVGTSAAVVLTDSPPPAQVAAAAPASADDVIARALAEQAEEVEVSRSAERPELPSEAQVEVEVTGTLLALTDGVAIRSDADGDAQVLGTLDKGDAVDVTGRTEGGWSEVVHQDLPRWVKTSSIGEKLPLGSEPCPYGSENGLQPDTVKVLRAVCAEFPEVTSYGGLANRGEHATGQALDIMVRGELGDRIAAFLQENRAALGIEYLIWKQQIWRPSTSASWRPMGDRGGDTANHFDHVHVTTFGTAATG